MMSHPAAPADVNLSDGKVEWTDVPVHIKDFANKYGVPNVAKVVKGQYKDVGVAKSVQSELYVHSVQTSQKVLAEGIKVKEGKRAIVIGNHKYSLPLSYQGWFELLSQDGKAVKAIASVQELSRSFPSSCIVRENFKAFIPRDTGELTLDKHRILQGGEQLNLVGEIWVTVNTNKGLVKRRLLHCLDVKGDSVYMGVEQKGLFSPIAGQTNISGVHSLRGLLDKFRFPILVRLVHGIIPSKLEKNFTGVFRLNGVYSEESIFVCPLKKDAKMVPISTREPLKLIAAANLDEVQTTDGFQYHTERCNKMINSYMNSIHLLFTIPDPNSVKPKKDDTLRSKFSSTSGKTVSPEKIEENILFEEVEDIYAYVREGGPTPPPPRPRPPQGAVAMLQKTKKAARQLSKKPSTEEPAKQEKSPNKSTPDSPVASPPSPELSSPKSPPVKSPAPKLPTANSPPAPRPLYIPTSPPADPFIPTKDDFWEEPIYEPLDKIRSNKRGSRIEEQIPAPIALTLPEVPPDYDDDSPPIVSPSAAAPFNQVHNLRQVYKLSHDGSFPPPVRPSQHISDEDIEELQEMLEDIHPPPVPPKKYSDHDTGSSISYPSDRESPRPEPDGRMETVMTFDDDDDEVPRPAPLRNEAPPRGSPVLMQTTIPTSPEPTVTVHTPLISYASTTQPSSSQPHITSQVLHPMSQSQDMLHHPPVNSTYVAMPQNGFHNPLMPPHHKVLLNRPKDPNEKQLLNNRGEAANGNNNPPPRSSVAYARGGPVVVTSSAPPAAHPPPNRVSLMRSHAPYVAVARVGEGDMYENRRRKMQSMYL